MTEMVYLPKITLSSVRPILRSLPPFVVGIPVFRATLLFKLLIPINLLNENEKPYLPLNPNINYFLKLFKPPSHNQHIYS